MVIAINGLITVGTIDAIIDAVIKRINAKLIIIWPNVRSTLNDWPAIVWLN